MWKGLCFFCKTGWKADKLYIIERVMGHLLQALMPVVAVAVPKLMIDELMGARRYEWLLLYAGILTGYTLVSKCLCHFFQMDGFTRRIKIASAFGLDLHENLMKADYENLEKPDFLDQKEKANKFLYCDWHGFSYTFDCALEVFGQLFTLIGISVIIAQLHPILLLLFLTLSLLDTVVEGRARKKAFALSLELIKDERGLMYYSRIAEDHLYAKEIRLNQLCAWLLEQEKKFSHKTLAHYKKKNGIFIRANSFGEWMSFVQQLCGTVYFIHQTVLGFLTIGDFTMYTGAVLTFINSVRTVLTNLVELNSYSLYYDALEEYLHIPRKLAENEKLPIPTGNHRIEFRNVSFRYSGQPSNALYQINLVLEPGQKLAVVGENGAGKTTFVKLLVRLYDPTEGEILLDGVDIRKIDYEAYMGLFSTVFQDYRLFAFSLKENVTLAKPIDADKTEAVLRKVGLGKLIDRLPDGIETSIYKEFDENGFEPSGGEGQKIALARALYRNAPIVILDEPTASLDPKAEYEIYQQFSGLVEGKSAVFITHRLSSAQFCDKIAVFQQGGMIEYGTHKQLLAQNGVYASLYQMQAQYYYQDKNNAAIDGMDTQEL